jgi:hypothetical protein
MTSQRVVGGGGTVTRVVVDVVGMVVGTAVVSVDGGVVSGGAVVAVVSGGFVAGGFVAGGLVAGGFVAGGFAAGARVAAVVARGAVPAVPAGPAGPAGAVLFGSTDVEVVVVEDVTVEVGRGLVVDVVDGRVDCWAITVRSLFGSPRGKPATMIPSSAPATRINAGTHCRLNDGDQRRSRRSRRLGNLT